VIFDLGGLDGFGEPAGVDDREVVEGVFPVLGVGSSLQEFLVFVASSGGGA